MSHDPFAFILGLVQIGATSSLLLASSKVTDRVVEVRDQSNSATTEHLNKKPHLLSWVLHIKIPRKHSQRIDYLYPVAGTPLCDSPRASLSARRGLVETVLSMALLKYRVEALISASCIDPMR